MMFGSSGPEKTYSLMALRSRLRFIGMEAGLMKSGPNRWGIHRVFGFRVVPVVQTPAFGRSGATLIAIPAGPMVWFYDGTGRIGVRSQRLILTTDTAAALQIFCLSQQMISGC